MSQQSQGENESNRNTDLKEGPDKRPFRLTLEAIATFLLIFGGLVGGSSHRIVSYWIYFGSLLFAAFGAPLPRIWAPIVSLLGLIVVGALTFEAAMPNKAAPPMPISAQRPRFKVIPNEVILTVGTNRITIPNSGEAVSLLGSMFTRHGGDDVTARFVNNEVLIEARLSAALELKNNEIRNLPIGWDVNSDDTALEIVNGSGNAVFQLIYEGANNAIVRGVFLRLIGQQGRPSGWILITDSRAEAFPATDAQIAKMKFFPLLFRYPSSAHQRERN